MNSIDYLHILLLHNRNNYLSLYLIQNSPDAQSPNTGNIGSGDEGVFKIDPGKSIMLSNAQFESSNYHNLNL